MLVLLYTEELGAEDDAERVILVVKGLVVPSKYLALTLHAPGKVLIVSLNGGTRHLACGNEQK